MLIKENNFNFDKHLSVLAYPDALDKEPLHVEIVFGLCFLSLLLFYVMLIAPMLLLLVQGLKETESVFNNKKILYTID